MDDQGSGIGNQGLEQPKATSPSSPVPESAPSIPLTPVTSANPESAAGVRFRSCRWMQPPESGIQPFCTHREVKPYAGTQGFDAEAWCPECQYYKLRRAPRKRNEETFTY
jgi:hypothetical protein